MPAPKEVLVQLMALKLLDGARMTAHVDKWLTRPECCEFLLASVKRLITGDFGTAPPNIQRMNIRHAQPGNRGPIWGGYTVPLALRAGLDQPIPDILLCLDGGASIAIMTPKDVDEHAARHAKDGGNTPSLN